VHLQSGNFGPGQDEDKLSEKSHRLVTQKKTVRPRLGVGMGRWLTQTARQAPVAGAAASSKRSQGRRCSGAALRRLHGGPAQFVQPSRGVACLRCQCARALLRGRPRPHGRVGAAQTFAMVNVDFSPALVLGMGFVACGLSLYQLRRIQPELSRDFDVVVSSIAIFCGGILVFQARAAGRPEVLHLSCFPLAEWPSTWGAGARGGGSTRCCCSASCSLRAPRSALRSRCCACASRRRPTRCAAARCAAVGALSGAVGRCRAARPLQAAGVGAGELADLPTACADGRRAAAVRAAARPAGTAAAGWHQLARAW